MRKKIINANGYLREYDPTHPLAAKAGYVLVHRKNWYASFGPIKKGYVIHHINHDKQDNRIENLQMLEAGAHSVLHLTKPHHEKFMSLVCVICKKVFERKKSVDRRTTKYYERIATTCNRRCWAVWMNKLKLPRADINLSEKRLRRCYKCHIVKPIENFGNNSKKPFGKGYRCKLCDNIRITKSRNWKGEKA